jgi:hypothetical protein
MDVGPLGGLRQRSDDMLRRPHLRIAAAEIDQGLAAFDRSRRDSGQQ